MTAGKKEDAKKKKTGTGGAPRTLKEDAEAELARAPKSSAGLDKKTAEELIYELQVHQTELEMQAEELRRAQLALEESRDKYLDLYDFAPLGYLTLTDEALVSQANLTAASLLGVDRSALVHARFRKWIVSEDLEIWDRYFTTLLQSAKKLTLTLLLRRGDKVTFPARLESIRLSGSSKPSIRVAVSDISDIRLAERASRDSANLLKTVIEHLPVGVMILDEREEIITINLEAEQIWGRAHSMDNGRNPPCTMRRLEDGGRIEVNDWAGARAVRKGETTLEEQIEVESPGGIRRILLNSALPLRRSDGSICGAVVVSQDITSGKTAETEIRWLASFPELNPDPVIELDAEGTVTFANSATKKNLLDLGLPPDPSLFLPEDRQEILQLLKQGTQSQVLREITLGSQNFEENIAMEIGLQVIRIYARNITKRKRAEEALKEETRKLSLLSDAFQTANRKLKLLSAITRHDINNQLTVVLGYLSLIRSDTPDNTMDDTLQKITRAAQQISRLIQFTKTYEEVGVSAPVFQDIRTLVKTAARELSGTVRLDNEIPPGRSVFADPLIVKVFFNLMDNAVRYGETITTIHFYGKEQDGDFVIRCEDDGVGIPADQKEKIFERGYGKNTGLGLFLAREILSITGISIRETGIPGKGARFEILVPKGMWHCEEADKTS